MRLNLYDKDLNRIAVIGSQYVSCLWSEGYNTTQPFTMELRETALGGLAATPFGLRVKAQMKQN